MNDGIHFKSSNQFQKIISWKCPEINSISLSQEVRQNTFDGYYDNMLRKVILSEEFLNNNVI